MILSQRLFNTYVHVSAHNAHHYVNLKKSNKKKRSSLARIFFGRFYSLSGQVLLSDANRRGLRKNRAQEASPDFLDLKDKTRRRAFNAPRGRKSD